MRDGAQANYWQLGTWGGVPVAMHWTVLLSFAWMYLIFWNLLGMVVAAAAFFVLLVIHELGHVVVLRRRKIPVEGITLYGIHGETAHGYAGPADEVKIAWGGVAAQALVLILALALVYGVGLPSHPLAAAILVPVMTVFIQLNIFVMVLALLPIGPFDGRAAWQVIPRTRARLKQRKKAASEREMFPENSLPPEKRRELEESSAKAAADLLEKMKK